MSERENIEGQNQAFQAALREGDAERCAALCTEDAVMMPPNAPPIEGRDAIERHFAKLGPDSSVAAKVIKLEVAGGLAYQLSRVSWGPKGKAKYTDSLDVFQRQDDGSWLFAASVWNSSEGFDGA